MFLVTNIGGLIPPSFLNLVNLNTLILTNTLITGGHFNFPYTNDYTVCLLGGAFFHCGDDAPPACRAGRCYLADSPCVCYELSSCYSDFFLFLTIVGNLLWLLFKWTMCARPSQQLVHVSVFYRPTNRCLFLLRYAHQMFSSLSFTCSYFFFLTYFLQLISPMDKSQELLLEPSLVF